MQVGLQPYHLYEAPDTGPDTLTRNIYHMKGTRSIRNTATCIAAALAMLSCCPSVLHAQDFRSSIRPWKDGRLTWDDFLKEDFHPDTVATTIYYTWKTVPSREKYGNLVIQRNISELYMDKTLSWVRTDCMTDANLRYQQVIFDLAELYRRKFQKELDSSPGLYDELLHFYDKACDKTIEEYRYKSTDGKNTVQTSIYEQKIRAELERIPDNDTIPGFVCKDFGIGYYIGAQTEVFFGTPASSLTPAAYMIAGAEFAYRKSIFGIEAIIGGGSIKQPFSTLSHTWDKGTGYSAIGLSATYTYPFIDSSRWRLGPFVSGGVNTLHNTGKEDSGEKEITGFKAAAGVNFAWKIRRRAILYGEGRNNGSYSENLLQLRMYATYSGLHPEISGYSLNISLTFNIFAKLLK